MREVSARIRRVLSRLGNHSYANKPTIVIDEHLAIDFTSQQVIVDGEDRDLTPKEVNLLYILLNNRGRLISMETLLTRVWPGEDIYEDTLRVHISRLRRKLECQEGSKEYILTERGTGYGFAASEERDLSTR